MLYLGKDPNSLTFYIELINTRHRNLLLMIFCFGNVMYCAHCVMVHMRAQKVRKSVSIMWQSKKKKKQLANESQMINQYKKLWRLQVCKLENCSELAEVCILLNAFFWFMKTNGLQYVLLSGNVLCSTQQLSECLTVLKFNFLH